MSGPFTLRLVRPYASRDAFLEADAWTVERSEMLLVGVEGVSPGATVNFEIVLENREVVVRGEGRALELVPPRDGRPGGVRLRFKQLDAASKQTLRKALEIQKRQAAAKVAEPALELPPPETVALQAPPPAVTEPLAAVPKEVAAEPPPALTTAHVAEATEPEPEELSGVHHRLSGPVPTPENREALLDRLRERARLRKGAYEAPVKSTAAAE